MPTEPTKIEYQNPSGGKSRMTVTGFEEGKFIHGTHKGVPVTLRPGDAGYGSAVGTYKSGMSSQFSPIKPQKNGSVKDALTNIQNVLHSSETD